MSRGAAADGRATYFGVYPLRRDASLLVTHRRSVEVDVPAALLAEVLIGSRDLPGDVESRTVDLVDRMRELLRATPARPGALVDTLTVAVDDELLDLLPHETLAALFRVADLKPEIVPTSAVLDLVADDDHALVTLTSSFDTARMFAWEDHARAAGLMWAPLHLTETGIAYGPYLEPADTDEGVDTVPCPGPRDLVARWITAADNADHVRARLNPPVISVQRPHLHDVLPALAAFAADVERWLQADLAEGSWHHVVHTAGRRVAHPVLPVPEAGHPAHLPTTGCQPGLSPADVVDAATGIVVGLRPIHLSPEFPRGAVYVESQTADMGRVRPWAANIYNAGSAWDDEDVARQGAIGEAVERYCGNVYRPEHLRRCSYDKLVADGEHAVDPRTLALFSPKQYARPGMPFVPFTTGLEVSWVPGRSLATGQVTWVPASLVYVNWNTGDSILDPPVNPAYYPGIAAAPSREAALCNALEEVVERDAAMVWWLSGAPLAPLPEPEFARRRAIPGSSVTTTFVAVPNRFSLPVLGAVVEDRSDGICTLGLACRHTPELAARKALLEGLGLVESARDMQRPDGGFWESYAEAGSPDQPIKDIRPDRRYLEDYRADFRDVTDLFCQLQVQLDPRARATTTARWRAQPDGADWNTLPELPERSSTAYVDALVDEGFDPLCVELTTSDVRAAGWTAVRVVVPGLVPNFPTAFPPLGTGRVQDEAIHLGLRAGPFEEDDVYRFPMPYA